MRRLGKALAAAALAAPLVLSPAHALLGVDMSTLSCQDWLDASDDEQELMIAWLRGNGAGRANTNMFNAAAVRNDRNALAAFCRRNPTIGVTTAMAQVLH